MLPTSPRSGKGWIFLMQTHDSAPAFDLIGLLSEKLMARRFLFGTAESCTGGLVAGACTDVAGSSRWFAGGLVTYSNTLKERLLGVPVDVLAEHGAVSGPVVRIMAGNALERLGVHLALAVSGIAGPDGGSPEKPVGTVWFGVALNAGNGPSVRVERQVFAGDRAAVRLQAVAAGLTLAENMIA